MAMRLTIGKKLTGSFLIVAVLLVIVAGYGIIGQDTAKTQYEDIMHIHVPTSELIWTLRANQLEMIAALRGFIIYQEESYIKTFNDLNILQQQREVEIDKLLETDESRQYLAKLKDLGTRYNAGAAQIFSYIQAGDQAAAEKVTEAIRPYVDEYKNANREWLDLVAAEEEQIMAEVEQEVTRTTLVSVVVTIVAVILSIIIALIISRGITKPVLQVVALLRDMAEAGGDLTKRISVTSKDEVGDLAQWFNAFMDKLHDIISQVRLSANMVATAANETSIGNQDLSQRTEEQASSLEEISSTIEEVTSSLQKSSHSATAADTTSKGTLQIVHKGEAVVNDLQQAMAEITKGSHEIADIIAKVNDIAFQTNLLALNAAVEAARAGEQGRGFAVVAAEVRNLAGRTAESAKEIEGLINTTIMTYAVAGN